MKPITTKKCKRLLVDLGICKKGVQNLLANKIGISYQTMSWTLTGKRMGEAYQDHLKNLYEYLIRLKESRTELQKIKDSLRIDD